MPCPAFPVEIYVQILNDLPGRDPSSLTTVVSCLSVSSTLRIAALEKSVWHNLFHSRYTHCDDGNEERRRKLCGGDIRLMFIERYKGDRHALRTLDLIRTAQGGPRLAAQIVRDMSFDVWDALGFECMLPIPALFRDPLVDQGDTSEDAAPHALPKRFWAHALRGAIARNYAVRLWQAIRLRDESATFDNVLLGFSAFMDVSPKESLWELESLAVRCRERLLSLDLELDSERPRYDLPAVLEAVRQFMQDEGFAIATGNAFINLLHQYPAYFLREGRSATLPISMNWVFAGICRRLGIQAEPTNTPGSVLCHITSPDPHKGDMLFDVCPSTTPPLIFSNRDLATRLAEADMPLYCPRDTLFPADLATMARRTVFNIMHAHRAEREARVHADGTWQRSLYAALIAASSAAVVPPGHNALPGPDVVLSFMPEEWPLDEKSVVQAAISLDFPDADIEAPSSHNQRIQRRLGQSETFVGQVLQGGDTLLCVHGWEVNLD
ncbi:hypothetical protein C8Q73DRAFT_788407 [Cubamyces lactineus]|nr:hypothetical protein C8Q73DRAFT_788407 [Cubamyces lactineus]